MSIVFDIETGPLPIDAIKQRLPSFDRSTVKHPGQFDPESVKTGNLGPEKAAQKIADAKAKHEQAVANYEADLLAAEFDHWQKIYDRAALSAVTGQIVAIGYQGNKTVIQTIASGTTEANLLRCFWQQYQSARAESRKLIGFNIREFDLPFIAQRSWMLGVTVPATLLTATGYLDSAFVDLRDRWRLGKFGGSGEGLGTLNAICRSCGLPGKPTDECDGKNFAEFLLSEDPGKQALAIAYLESDLQNTYTLADRLGVL